VKVTIGIPVFNGAEFLEAALDAACTQEWPELEILVADNASTDRSVEIAEARCRSDERVRLIRAEENRGAAWNFNRLVEQAKGEFFWWLPHDDVLEPRAVELCVQRLLANPEAVSCHPRTTYIDRTGWPIGLHSRPLQITSPSPAARLGRFLIEHSRCDGVLGLHRLAALRRTGLIRGFRGGDEILYAELAIAGVVLEEPEPLYGRRLHEGSSLQARTDEEANAWFDPASTVTFKDVGRFLATQFHRMVDEQGLTWTQARLCHLQVERWRAVRWMRLRKRQLRGTA